MTPPSAVPQPTCRPDLEMLEPARLRRLLAASPAMVAPPPFDLAPDGQSSVRPLNEPTGPMEVERYAAVLVALVPGEVPGVLLTRRAAGLRQHGGQVAFPGGRIDPGDDGPEAAALREAWEEIGLDPAGVQILGRLPALVTGTAYHITPVVGLVSPGLIHAPEPREVAAVFELPLHVVCDPAAPTRKVTQMRGAWVSFWVWPHAHEHIWGATAAILVELAAVLRQAA